MANPCKLNMHLSQVNLRVSRQFSFCQPGESSFSLKIKCSYSLYILVLVVLKATQICTEKKKMLMKARGVYIFERVTGKYTVRD